MTDLERVSYLRFRSAIWLTLGIVLFFGFFIARGALKPLLPDGVYAVLILAVSWVPVLIGLSYSVRFLKLARRTKECGDELTLANRNTAVRFSFLASLVAIPVLLGLAVPFDWSAFEALIAMEAVMIVSFTVIWGYIEIRQTRQVASHD